MPVKKAQDEVVEPTPLETDEPVKRESGYHIKEGCAVISRGKGVVGPDTGVLKPEWFTGGEDTLKKLVKSGQVEKV